MRGRNQHELDPVADAALAARYLELGPCSLEIAAKRLGVGEKKIIGVLGRTGTKRHAPIRSPVPGGYDGTTERYRDLPPMSLTKAAAALGVSRRHLADALSRTRTPRHSESQQVPILSLRSGWEPLPAGHPVSFGAIMARLTCMEDAQ
jgi:hypothetical protein